MEDYLVARKQPTGVKILSVLALLGAVLMTAVTGWAIFAFLQGDKRLLTAGKMMSEMGMPAPIAAASFLFLFVLAWASGIGMGLGKRWGWYCGTFWYAYAMIRALNALLFIFSTPELFTSEARAASAHGPDYYYFKYGGRFAISCVIYIYLFGDNVREYFGIRGSKWKVVVEQFGTLLGAVVSGSALAFLLQD